MMQQELTDQQHQAIELFATGQKPRCIAETLNIRRETLWRWRQLPEFQQAYRERQQLRREETRDQIAEIVRLALASITRELADAENPKKYNPFKDALNVLTFLRNEQLMHDNPINLT